ncbi:hypothetical protein HDU92_006651 [Lobulomyces angularis]|nr:hypothetical protein HDU92_006651 [Lobulomyces angularis]
MKSQFQRELSSYNVLRIPNPENRKRQVVVKTKLYLIMLTSVVLDSASTLLYLYSPKMVYNKEPD